MKSVMDCDGVFEILTRAPFPSGDDSDAAVEAHLCVCHDCRRLADALRPAVGLFHESLSGDDSLPEYAGRLAERPPGFALRTPGYLHPGPLIAAMTAACLVLWVLRAASHSSWSPPTPGRSATAAQSRGESPPTLAGLNLPLPCFRSEIPATGGGLREVASHPAIREGRLEYQCCTTCHRPQGIGPATARAVHVVTTSCASCHSRPPTPEVTWNDAGERWFAILVLPSGPTTRAHS